MAKPLALMHMSIYRIAKRVICSSHHAKITLLYLLQSPNYDCIVFDFFYFVWFLTRMGPKVLSCCCPGQWTFICVARSLIDGLMHPPNIGEFGPL
jgi:uncharacterized membrane protein